MYIEVMTDCISYRVASQLLQLHLDLPVQSCCSLVAVLLQGMGVIDADTLSISQPESSGRVPGQCHACADPACADPARAHHAAAHFAERHQETPIINGPD